MSEQHHVSHLIFWKQYTVSKGGSSNVFHGCDAEFWAVDAIIFGKREFLVKKLFVKFNALGNSSENQVRVKKFQFGFSDKDPHGSKGIVSFVLNFHVVTSTHGVDVGTTGS